jgi:hypothetical protein
MNERQLEYFRRKLLNWKAEILADSRDTGRGAQATSAASASAPAALIDGGPGGMRAGARDRKGARKARSGLASCSGLFSVLPGASLAERGCGREGDLREGSILSRGRCRAVIAAEG